VSFADRTDGDIDTLANRIAHIRTWTFAANRPDWLRDPHHWQERTRAIEDRLSDALHERLTARFVDRRTSVLMRRLKENAMLEAEITATGDVMVEGQHVGNLDGFRFALDPNATDGPETKALRAAAQKALAGEIVNRADKVATAANGDFVLAGDGALRWQGTAIAKLTEGDDALKPAPSALLATLWALKNGGLDVAGLPELTRLAASGRTSVPVDESFAKPLYRVVGYKLAGTRAVRIDILERLADIIRPLIAWRPTAERSEPPPGAIAGYGFTATVGMTSLLGCSGEDFASVLRSLGYRVERKPVPPKPAAEAAPAVPSVEAVLAAEPPESAAAEAVTPEAEPALDVAVSTDASPLPGEASAGVSGNASSESNEALSADTIAASAAPDAQPAEANAEPQFIEIWRPGRKERDQHPPRHNRRPRREAKPAAAQPEGQPAAEANGGAPAQPQREPHHKHRRQHGREDNERRDRRQRPEGRREHRDRDDRRDDRPRRGERPEPVRFSTETPRGDKRSRPADPNSPFAALAALKAELEAKERGG
jgi:hypothetical protein